jgi:hypothetical protein
MDAKHKRAMQARINGAKSKGAKTPEGQHRTRTASLQHGLYATPDTLRHTVDPVLYEQFRQEIQAIWDIGNKHITTRVNHLVSLMWEMDRLIATRRQYMEELFQLNGASVSDIEVLVSQKGDILERIDARIRRLNLEISRIERDLLHLKKGFAQQGPSHKPLQTQDQPFSTGPCYQETPYQKTPGPSANAAEPPYRPEPAGIQTPKEAPLPAETPAS